MTRLLIFVIALSVSIVHHGGLVLAQQEADAVDEMADRLQFMQEQAEAFQGKTKAGVAIKALPAPLLRWTNPHSNIKDGALVCWTDTQGVPVAAAQICLTPNSDSEWAIELQSLASEPLTLQNGKIDTWIPKSAGVTWSRDKKAGVPANDAKRRLIQMRSLARRFRADDDFEQEESSLRLLPNPLLRYSNPDAGIIDGGLFSLVHGTDPELLILVEARKSTDRSDVAVDVADGADPGSETWYQWALAPMTTFELKAFLDRKEVWHKPQMTSNLPSDVFLQRLLVPGPPKEKSVLSSLRDLLDL